MEFNGVRLLPLRALRPSQLYISADKLSAVEAWFSPNGLERFQPLPVHDFGDRAYTLTDGHTRAFAAYRSGVSRVPVIYDSDASVTDPLCRSVYLFALGRCRRHGVRRVRHLETRVLDGSAYQMRWNARCERCFCLLSQTSAAERDRLQACAPGLYLYGASEDGSVLFFESQGGELFSCQNYTLRREIQ